MLAAISASHLSPLLSSFSLLYRSSSCVSVENSKLGPCRRGAGAGESGPSQELSPPPPPPRGPAHLHDGIHGAGLLAEAAVDALSHVDVVARGPAAAIGPRLSLDGDGLGGGTGDCQLLATLAPGTGLSPAWAYRKAPLSSTLSPRGPFLTLLLRGHMAWP